MTPATLTHAAQVACRLVVAWFVAWPVVSLAVSCWWARRWAKGEERRGRL